MTKFFTSVVLILLSFSRSHADITYASDCGLFGCSTSYHSSEITSDQDVDIDQDKALSPGHFKLKIKHNRNSQSPSVASQKLAQIPIQFLNHTNSTTDTFASITEIWSGSQIFAGALHVFKRKINETIAFKTRQDLSQFKALVFRDTDEAYADLVLFIPSDASEIDFEKILPYLQDPIKGMYWKSPQVGYLRKDLVEQMSKGYISIVPQLPQGAPYFYLEDSKSNFSSRGSSGSVIFSEDNRALGVLQCKEDLSSSDLRGENVNFHYRALSLLFSLQYFKPELINSLEELSAIAQKWTADPNCIPVDKNGAGGI